MSLATIVTQANAADLAARPYTESAADDRYSL